MKILSNLLLCALILCALSSCQKDESELPLSVHGKWEITAISCQDGIRTIFENGATSGGTFVFDGQAISAGIEFKSDASFTGSGKYTKVFSTLVGRAMQNDYFESSDFANEGVWKKTDVKLELTSSDIEIYEIIELTSNKMHLKFNLNETVEKDKVIIQDVGTVFYTLRR